MGKAVDWEFVYPLSNDCTLDNILKMFQYKLLHRTIPTNTFLHKCKLVETELCAFCGETKETILHLFCDSNIVNNIWLKYMSNCRSGVGVSRVSPGETYS